MAISGIYDLEPIRHSYLNEKLRADEATSRRNSPMMQAGGPLKPLSLVVGSAELPLLRKQTADFAGHRARYGLPVTYEEIPGADHFTIMHEMMSPKGRITTLIRQLFERTRARLAVIASACEAIAGRAERLETMRASAVLRRIPSAAAALVRMTVGGCAVA